ncbi:hypothetical protein FOA52_007742 [Chlamydomonas sp. UWO 241]|nr:hypothetical protein FOA52_007742 [Chlamydomonas sp. UWO 241]
MSTEDGISLRPVVLRPGGNGLGPGGNPFSMFSKGSGQVLKSKMASKPAEADVRPPKRDEDRVKYAKDFLMTLMDTNTQAPIELVQQSVLNAEIIISEQSEKDKQRETLQKAVVDDEIDDGRDWRTRTTAAAPNPPAANGGGVPPPAPNGGGGEVGSKQASKQASASDARWEPKADQSSAKEQPREAPKAVQAQQRAAPAPSQGQQGSAMIQKAADIGMVAYRPGAGGGNLTAEERATRQVKGILNKLTPEKFERLLQQLLGVITTADVLKSTIATVFENAVEQPTFCAMYAELCQELAKELPSFPPPPGEDKPLTFITILLNTCQDEFEASEEQKEVMHNMTEADERELAERAVKKRTMGTMRLISELYKKDMVRDWIITACMEALLAKGRNGRVSEDSVEAACEVLSTAGIKLSVSPSEKMQRKLEEVMRQLAALEKDKNISSRLRFVVRDVAELRRSNWVPRREAFTAKKLDEIRANAEAELGMVSTATLAATLPSLPALPGLTPGGRAAGRGAAGASGGAGADDFALIPPLREGDVGGWGFPTGGAGAAATGSAGSGGGGAAAGKFSGGGSALLGDFRPPSATVTPAGGASTTTAAAPKPAVAAAPKPAAAGAPTSGSTSEDELKRKTESLLAEFLQTLDAKEALVCFGELAAPADFLPKLVEAVLEAMLNSIKDKEAPALEGLLVAMHAGEVVSPSDVEIALRTYCGQLEDLALDVPKAPKLLGSAFGAAVVGGALGLDAMQRLLEGDSGVESKREFAAEAFKKVLASAGADGLKAQCAAAGVAAGAYLAADELDGPECLAVDAWLSAAGLSMVPV